MPTFVYELFETMQSSVTRSRTSITKSLPASFRLSIFALSSESYIKIHCFSVWNTLFPGVKLLVSNRVETNYEIALLIFLWWWNQRVEIWFDYELVQTPTFAHMMNLYTLLVGHIYSAWWVYIPTTLDI